MGELIQFLDLHSGSLKSNGLPRPKIRLKKFGFSLKIVPANIVRKLPSQRCFKPLFIASFNFSHKRRNVRFKGLQRVHTRLCSKNRTQRHTRRNRGPSLPRPQRSLVLPAISLLFHHAFIYIHFPVPCEPPSSSRGGNSSKTAVTNAVPDRFSSRFSTSPTNGPRSLSQAKAGTPSAFGEKSHTRAHTAKQVAFWMGVVSLPSERFTRFGNPAWPGIRKANFAAFGSWPGVLSKNTESLRSSDALMRVAAPRRRGPAGLRIHMP